MNAETIDIYQANFPVLGHRDRPVSLDSCNRTVTADRFLADVAALAERLPDREHVINLCNDRYRFSVGFIAALQRRQVTLLPASQAIGPLEKLVSDYRDSYFLLDAPFAFETLSETFQYPKDLSGKFDPSIPTIASNQTAAILYTSGSTGAPTPNRRSWSALINSTRDAAEGLGIARLQGAHLLGTVPHQHSYGLESIVMLSLQHGLTIHVARSLLPADIISKLETMPAPRILVTTPIHLRSLLAYEGALPGVHTIICATASLSCDVARLAEDRFGAQLHEIYGCSEVGQIALRRTVETEQWTCLKGIDLNERNGEVWASGKAAAAAAPLNDIVSLRGKRHFILHGRKSDMVNIAGKRSSLSFLNHHLNAIEGVRDGVFVMPDEDESTTRLIAYVVAPGLSADHILRKLRLHFDPAFLPRPIYFVDALPRNALGKLTRQAMEGLR